MSFLDTGAILSTKSQMLIRGFGNFETTGTPGDALCFYFPDFFLSDGKPWIHFEHVENITLAKLLCELEKLPAKPIDTEWNEPSISLFSEQFDSLKKEIAKGALQKAVPYAFTFTEKEMIRDHLVHCLKGLLKYALSHPVHVYGFWDNGKGILGATPELLFDLEKDRLKTCAVAGTGNGSIINDPKELHEHELVVEGIKEALHSYGTLEVGAPEMVKLSDLSHLLTPIELKGAKGSFQTFVEALHPTPALGAYPKKAGAKWLKYYQTLMPRARFGAPVGYCKENIGRCVVAIRNMQWDKNQIRIGAGCGVVKTSQKEKEWQELKLKIAATKNILAI